MNRRETRKQKKTKEEPTPSTAKSADPKCLFCGHPTDLIRCGRMYKLNDIYVHYYCLLLSSGLVQNGRDSQGILGFLERDIRKERKRVSKLKCSYCKEMGANIGCCVRSCKVSFHLPCGLKNDALCRFNDLFDSYCKNHRKKQTLDPKMEINELCPICFDNNDKFDGGIHVLITPCCHKLAHRTCLQYQALSAGYFYKCPLCNNGDTFKQEMVDFGIYVPKRDASWEEDPNSFGELYQNYSRCDQDNCLCPHGRHHNDEDTGQWQILICNTCGSKGTHWSCLARPNWLETWVCEDCQIITRNNSIASEDDDNDIQLIDSVDNPSNSINESTSKPIIKLSNELIKVSEIDVFDGTPNKRKKIRPQMKDIGIQCELVDVKQLIDCEPFNKMDSFVFKNSIISIKNQVIDLSDSEDDCIIID